MYVCESCECQVVSGSQKRALDPLDLELQVVHFRGKFERVKGLVMCRAEGTLTEEMVYECSV